MKRTKPPRPPIRVPTDEELENFGLLSRIEREVGDEKRRFGERLLSERIATLPPESGRPKACPFCGANARVRTKDVPRTLQCVHGEVSFKRNYHYCEKCRKGFYPMDRFLGVPEEGDVTTDLESRIADFVVNDTFENAEERWLHHYGFPLSANQFRQVAKRLGAMIHDVDAATLQNTLRPPEGSPDSTLYVMTDGSMVPMRGGEWNEVKVGVLFHDEHHVRGEGVRGCVTESRYVAVVGDQVEFSKEMDAAISVARAAGTKQVVWLGDGARSNWTLAGRLCPLAVQVLDWYHAVENAMPAARAIFGDDGVCVGLWKSRIEHLLMNGDLKTLERELVECKFEECSSEAIIEIDRLLMYYRRNKSRMRYDLFRECGLLIGSGAVESAHKHVIQNRMKQTGQHWSRDGARGMARLRAAYRTAGPRRFHCALHWAHRNPPKEEAPRRVKRRASNR